MAGRSRRPSSRRRPPRRSTPAPRRAAPTGEPGSTRRCRRPSRTGRSGRRTGSLAVAATRVGLAGGPIIGAGRVPELLRDHDRDPVDPVTGQDVHAVLAGLPRHGVVPSTSGMRTRSGASDAAWSSIRAASIHSRSLLWCSRQNRTARTRHSVRDRDAERRDVGATSGDDGRIPAAPIRRCRRPELACTPAARWAVAPAAAAGPWRRTAVTPHASCSVTAFVTAVQSGPACARARRRLARDRAGRRVRGRDSGL